VCVCVFVALVIQHAERMCHIMLVSVVCVVLQYSSALTHTRYDFMKKVIYH
jgi:hypothetical protein